MVKTLMITGLIGTACLVTACKAGYNRIYDNSDPEEETPDCIEAPITGTASDETKEVFRLIADLSCERIEDYVLVGQSLGAGDQIVDNSDDNRSYQALVEGLASKTGRYPAIISIDYEEVEQFDKTALNNAHEQLKAHADSNGIISITWTPFNPWKETSASDPLTPNDDVDLALLYGEDDNSAAWGRFNSQLTLVSEQLKALSDMKVPVLFSPFPQMNIKERWYGAHNDNSESKFVSLWNHVYNTINDQKPTNLIWVYSPLWGNDLNRKSATWGYPDSSRIDIIGGFAYSNILQLGDYEEYEALNKPLGLTRLAPESTTDGSFDNTNYVNLLSSQYPFIAYWIAEHNTPVTNQEPIKRAIVSNANANELMKDKNTATRETIDAQNWLDLP